MSILTRIAGWIAVVICFFNLREITDMLKSVRTGEKNYEKAEVIRSVVLFVGTSLISLFLFYLCCLSDTPHGQ